MFSIWILYVMCAVTFLCFSDASPAPIVGYACNDTTHYLKCTTTHRYCYQKGTVYVPCYGICNMDSISTKDVERCQAECAEYFTKECWAVYATTKAALSPTTQSSSSTAAVSDPGIASVQGGDSQSGSTGQVTVTVVVIIGVVVIIVVIVIAVVCVRRHSPEQMARRSYASNIAMGNICSCCYRMEQRTGMGLNHGERDPSTEPLVTSNGTTLPASNGGPPHSPAQQSPCAVEPAVTGEAADEAAAADDPAAADEAGVADDPAAAADEAAVAVEPAAAADEPAAEYTTTDTIASQPVSTPVTVSESQVQQPTCP